MKRIFEKDITLRIISLLLAIGVWFYIIIVLNPSVEVTIREIPVQYVEQTKLTERGLSIVNEKKPTVEVKIKGNRNIVTNINEKNIVATVNLSSVDKIGPHPLPILVSLPFEDVSVIERKPYTVDIMVDKILEERKDIKVYVSGDLKPGFTQGEIKVTPSNILIKGTSSAIKQIDEAAVYLNYDGKDKDVTESQKIVLLDADKNDVTNSYNIIKDVDTVEIHCPVLELKQIPVVPKFSDDIQSKIDSGALKMTVFPEVVTVYASSVVVAQIDKILTENIELRQVTQETSLTVKPKIPDNINIRDDFSEVRVTLVPAGE